MPRHKVGFCVIGTGRAGAVHIANIARRIPEAALTALCDANNDTLQRLGDQFGVASRYTDHEAALARPDVDAVVIATPAFTHRDVACAAADRGKHVFLEKPMALTPEACRDINAAVERTGVRLQLGFMRRFHAGFLEAKALLDSGEMGRVTMIRSTGRGPGLPPPWIFDIRKSNGVLAEVNSHDLDAVRWLAGDEIVRLYAEAGNFKCRDVLDTYPDFYDTVVVSLRLSNGALGIVDGACPCGYGYDARMEILCEQGVIFIGETDRRTPTKVTVDGKLTRPTVRSWRSRFRDAYLAEMEHFVDCVLSGREPRATGADGLRAVEAVVAANRSLASGRPVEIAGDMPR